MQRRDFIAILAGAAAVPIAARAEERERRIGVLTNLAEDDPETRLRLGAFRKGLEELGWKVGGNVRLDYRWSVGDSDRIRVNAGELIALKPDLILAHGGVILRALKRLTRPLPIVFVSVADPVGSGLVASLSRPGGNVTGFALYE